MDDVTRRLFLRTIPAIVPAAVVTDRATILAQPTTATPDSFPRQEAALVREMVTVAHGNVARVKELVAARPAFARAAWDWGYGDWETALGAASHVGNREIAAVLLAAGAHPTIFSAAMLGQLDAVKAFVSAAPGIQKTRGPHGIHLLDHARAGKSDEVVRYLEALGDAAPAYPNEAMANGDPEHLLGSYAFGAATSERLIVGRNARGALVIKREGESDRNLFHHGGRVFNPAGAEAVRIRFEPAAGTAAAVVIEDGPIIVRASRIGSSG